MFARHCTVHCATVHTVLRHFPHETALSPYHICQSNLQTSPLDVVFLHRWHVSAARPEHSKPEEIRRGSENGSVKHIRQTKTLLFFTPLSHFISLLTHVGWDSCILTLAVHWQGVWMWKAMTSAACEHQVREQRRQRALFLHVSSH